MKVYYSVMAICLAGALWCHCANSIAPPNAVEVESGSNIKQVGLSSIKSSNVFQPTSDKGKRMLMASTDDEFEYFQIHSALSTNTEKWCLQPDKKDIVIKSCRENYKGQLWRVDKDSRFHNLRDDNKCIVKNGKNIQYRNCEGDGSAFIAFSIFNNKLVAGGRVLTMVGDGSGKWNPENVGKAQLRPNRLFKHQGQLWSIDYGNLPQLTSIGNPCHRYLDSGSQCQECNGDCDEDDDCEGSLRCAQREAEHGRELVPGCEWGPNSKYYRFSANDYCFQPVKVQGEVNYIGECKSNDQCGLCEGGCNNDYDCAGNLKCYHRYGFENVPGCKNHAGPLDMYGKNICYDPYGLPKIKDIGECAEDSLDNTCIECEGGCSNDNDCEGHLRCAKRAVGAIVPGCTFDEPELKTGDKNYCFEPLHFPSSAGRLTYVGECDPNTYKCQRCQGNCANNNDCAQGLTCFIRGGTEAVAGCLGEGGDLDMQGQNICYDASNKSIIRNQPHCGRHTQCNDCVGHCKYDEDCKGSLRCAKRDGFEDVPGCKWGSRPDASALPGGTDYCFQPVDGFSNIINYIGECGPFSTYLCGKCEGSCFSDADCKVGLKCKERFGYEPVEGCIDEGGARDMFAKNVCYSTPAPNVSPTPSPSAMPTSFPSTSVKPTTSTGPTEEPSQVPSANPTSFPSAMPTSFPSTSIKPTISTGPTEEPSQVPSANPSESSNPVKPTSSPSPAPTNNSSQVPSANLSESSSPTIFDF